MEDALLCDVMRFECEPLPGCQAVGDRCRHDRDCCYGSLCAVAEEGDAKCTPACSAPSDCESQCCVLRDDDALLCATAEPCIEGCNPQEVTCEGGALSICDENGYSLYDCSALCQNHGLEGYCADESPTCECYDVTWEGCEAELQGCLDWQTLAWCRGATSYAVRCDVWCAHAGYVDGECGVSDDGEAACACEQ